MGDVLPTLVVLVVGVLIVVRLQRPFERRERELIALAFGAHVIASFAQVWITRGVYGGGDMTGYHRVGTLLASFVRHDPGRFLPEVFTLILHDRPAFPLPIFGTGNPTGTMMGVSALLQLVLNDSLYASCVTISIAAFVAELHIYKVFRDRFPARSRSGLLVATMLLPSVVFWSSGMIKEALAMAAFGRLVYGAHLWTKGRYAVALFTLVLAAMCVALVKPYILIASALASAAWWYWQRMARTSKRAQRWPLASLLVAAGGATTALIVIGKIFPRYSLGELATEMEHLQTVGARISGGSNYSLAAAGGERSLLAQLALTPMALGTALFRPFFFEVSSGPSLVNAVETSVLSFVFVRALFKHPWRHLYRVTAQHPILVFGVVFIAIFGTAVGLASTNLGSLSRYRIPLMPFFAALLFAWAEPAASTDGRMVEPAPSRPSQPPSFPRAARGQRP